MSATPRLLALFALTACSDYDIMRTDKDPGQNEHDTAFDPEAPNLVISPDPLDFGTILKNCPSNPLRVTLENRGGAALNVQDIQFAGDGRSSFSHDGQAIVLEPYESSDFEVIFNPGDYLDYDVHLVVSSNDPVGDEQISVQGTGVEGATYEEVFTQEPYDKVDILWVVDNSGSMEDTVGLLRTNFSSFIQGFTGLGLDYHMAAVTTDMVNPQHSGRIRGSVITSEMDASQASSLFLASVDVGASGSSDEMGLAAVQAALTEPLLSNENVGFMRDDAALAIIVVSDENDSSAINASQFTTWFRTLKSDPDRVRMHGFIGLEATFDFFGCTVDSVAQKYKDVSDATGGQTQHICLDDWSSAMTMMSLASAGLANTFSLSAVPSNLADLYVYVDGVEAPYGIITGWTYDSSLNAIIFHGTSVPLVGQTVTVHYPTSECRN